MKNIALALLLGSSALVAVPALAQSNDATTTAPAASGMSAAGGDFVTARQPDQFLASNIRGANVMGAQNDNIGTVSDMIVDRDGKLSAVTVDVGGFLGIGAKTVALSVSALEFVPVSAAAGSNMASNNAMAPAGTAAPAAGTATNGTDPAVTGSTAPDSTATTSPTGGMAGGTAGTSSMQSADNTAAAGTANGTRLDHIKVNFTRDQLQNAPEFND